MAQDFDALYRFQRNGCDHRRLFPAPGIGRNIGQLEELTARMAPTEGRGNYARHPRRVVKAVVAAVGVGLQDAHEVSQMTLGMFLSTIS